MAYVSQVCKDPVFHDLDLPLSSLCHPFKNNLGAVLGVVTSWSNQKIKIEIDKNR